MCGIAAIIWRRPNKHDEGHAVSRMIDSLRHRGPDDEGRYLDSWVALGHRRLSIIDVSDAGAQPMWDSTRRFAVTFNGEIYNFRELRHQLSEYPFESESDTEVILAAFSAWGIEAFARFNGIFALAIYDSVTKRVVAARDRFGIKPLYYASTDSCVLLASEQRSLLQSGLLSAELSTEALTDYLRHGAVWGSAQILGGIQELPAGSVLSIEAGAEPSITSYASIGNTVRPRVATTCQAYARVRELFIQAVERQMVSDVPLGAFLSGGIDSSAIVAAMSQVRSDRPLTFTIGLEDASLDESANAKLVARKFRTHHSRLLLRSDDCISEVLAALRHMDAPTLDGVNTYVVSKLTRAAGVKVALSGLGGDELFAGYSSFERYQRWRSSPYWVLPRVIRRQLGEKILRSASSGRVRRLGELSAVSAFDVGSVYPIMRAVMDKKGLGALLPFDPSGSHADALDRPRSTAVSHLPQLSQYSVAEMAGYAEHMLLRDTDQMSMASGLEVRVPFFDVDLVEYVLSLPDHLKLGHPSKPLLLGALDGILPLEVTLQPKRGFGFPWDQWMRSQLRDLCENALRDLARRELLAKDEIARLWSSFLAGDHSVSSSTIWMLVSLEHWLQNGEQ
jgi:asparagine synthase (glutamine-hydrolysing)